MCIFNIRVVKLRCIGKPSNKFEWSPTNQIGGAVPNQPNPSRWWRNSQPILPILGAAVPNPYVHFLVAKCPNLDPTSRGRSAQPILPLIGGAVPNS